MNQEQLSIRSIRSATGVISFTFEFLRQNFSKFSRTILFYAGPAVLLMSVCMGILGLQDRNATGMSMLAIFSGTSILMMILGVVVIALQSALVNSFVMLYMDRGREGFEIRDVWGQAKQDFVAQLLTLYTLAVIDVILFGLIALTGPFVIIFILPLIYVGIATSLTTSIRSRERLGLVDAIKRSFSLISENWWATFWMFLLMGIIIGTVLIVFYFPIALITMTIGWHDSDASSDFRGLLSIVTGIIGLIMYLLQSVLLLSVNFQYYNLVEKKEGTGMLEQIESIGMDQNLQDHTA